MTGPMGSHTTQEVALTKTRTGLDWTNEVPVNVTL